MVSRPIGAPSSNLTHHGSAVAEQISEILSTMSWDDGSISGCRMGRALVINVNQPRQRTKGSSNATSLRGTEDFFASLVHNTLVRLRQTRLVSHTKESTEQTTAIVTVPAIVFGNKKFVWVLGILNLFIVLAFVFEFISTRGWAATPPLDIMNDSQVIMAAFEGGQRFERIFEEGGKHELREERLSDDTLLSLQFKGMLSERPVFIPHLSHNILRSDPSEEELLAGRRDNFDLER